MPIKQKKGNLVCMKNVNNTGLTMPIKLVSMGEKDSKTFMEEHIPQSIGRFAYDNKLLE